MDCLSIRELLHDLRRGRLDPARAAEVRAHLAGCAECSREEAAEAALDLALAERLPRYPAPAALRRRVEELAASSRRGALAGGPWTVALPDPPPAAVPLRRRAPSLRRLWAPAAVAAMAILSAGLVVERQARNREEVAARLGDEVVTDHLRLLVSEHPHDIESGVNHQVKPWFEGRLDFAPAVPGGRGDLRLLGGAVGYVLDRKAAAISYGLGRHRVTLLVFPGEGIALPEANRSLGGIPAFATSRRGFETLLWRGGDLVYALVSDANPKELEQVAAELARETRT